MSCIVLAIGKMQCRSTMNTPEGDVPRIGLAYVRQTVAPKVDVAHDGPLQVGVAIAPDRGYRR